MRIASTTVLAGMLLAVPTQLAAQPTPPSALETSAAFGRVPIHTLQGDGAPEYGWWTAAASFKASFHDGFVFYPYLGPDYPENLPLRWTTESITAGGQPLVVPGTPEHAHTEWRYEYRYGAVTEAYDVREDGIEQIFVVHVQPMIAGDLVVTGRLDTRLRAIAPLASAHAALSFADEQGRALVEYGAALVVDASGAQMPITTGFDGMRVRLTVPGEWLARAAFPVTIDPLTSRVTTSTSTGSAADDPAICREDKSDTTMILVSRQFSATDKDTYATLVDDSFSYLATVFTNIYAGYNEDQCDVTFVGGADRWVLAMTAAVSGSTSAVLYFHDRQDRGLNRGTYWWMNNYDSPAVGGTMFTAGGSLGLLVVRATGSPGRSDLHGYVIDAATRQVDRSRWVQINPATLDAFSPDVNVFCGNSEGSWFVVYSARTRGSTTDDYDVYATRVDINLWTSSSFRVGPDTGPDKVQPCVDGMNGRYLVGMIRNGVSRPDPAQLWTERIDWAQGQAFPTWHGATQLGSAFALSRPRLSFDTATSSHWCLVSQADDTTNPRVHARRLGYTGGLTELATLDGAAAGRYDPTVTFNRDEREFQIVYCSNESMQPVYAQRLVYPADAINVAYGSACGDAPVSVVADPPYAGSELFRMIFSGRPNGTSCVLMLSLSSTGLPLDALGMTGCVLHVSTTPGRYLAGIPITLNARAEATLQLPDSPLFQGDLFGQWLWVQPGLNPAGLGASNGLRMQVR